MRAGVAHSFTKLVNDSGGRRQVRVSHAEIDDVRTARTSAGFELVHLLEDVGREPPDLVELFHICVSDFERDALERLT